MKCVIGVIAIISLTGCNAVTNQQGGAVLGGAAGGILGSTIGKGSGNTAATIGGTILGVLGGSAVGASMDRAAQQQPASVHYPTVYESPRAHGYWPRTSTCSRYIDNQGAHSACQRGLSDSNRNRQRRLENEAYRAGKSR